MERASADVEAAFGSAARWVDRGKDALLAAVPHGRGPRVPVAEALAAFEDDLREAREALDGWPGTSASAERDACRGAVEESLRRAAALRLEATPQGYEELYSLLGHALDSLDVFAEVAGRIRTGR
jgi:hypothetical protein